MANLWEAWEVKGEVLPILCDHLWPLHWRAGLRLSSFLSPEAAQGQVTRGAGALLKNRKESAISDLWVSNQGQFPHGQRPLLWDPCLSFGTTRLLPAWARPPSPQLWSSGPMSNFTLHHTGLRAVICVKSHQVSMWKQVLQWWPSPAMPDRPLLEKS